MQKGLSKQRLSSQAYWNLHRFPENWSSPLKEVHYMNKFWGTVGGPTNFRTYLVDKSWLVVIIHLCHENRKLDGQPELRPAAFYVIAPKDLQQRIFGIRVSHISFTFFIFPPIPGVTAVERANFRGFQGTAHRKHFCGREIG